MKKRLLALSLLFFFLLPAAPARAEESGPAAIILYEPRTGTVLQARNPDAQMLIASTTKIMTALVVLESCRLQDSVEVTQEETEIEGSSASLCPGTRYTVEELLYGLMLASGNDAACALADHAAGGTEAFAERMNRKAEALGLENTHFENPHGLDAPEHYSSARDLALLTAAAMENETFCRIFATQSYSAHGVEYRNHNKLLESLEGCLGGKTGYTRAAGRTLVSCAEREGLRLICVTLSDPNDWEDQRAAYETAFSAYEYLPFPAPEWQRLSVISGVASDVALRCTAAGALVHRGVRVTQEVALPRFVFAPVAEGERLGSVAVLENGRAVYEAEIFAAYAVKLDENERAGPWMRFRSLWSAHFAGTFTPRSFLA